MSPSHLRSRPVPDRLAGGVALIEALVALAVMAFGLLGVVGMQATLRFNADVSRQRAEAVRMAQQQLEEMRAFGVLSGAAVGQHDYSKIINATDTPTLASGFANTSFTRTTTVFDPGADDPRMKSIQVEVAWLDRRTAAGGTAERVVLTSSIARSSPIVSAALGLPGDRAGPQRPLGRHVAIPRGALDLGDGTSRFTPPGAPPGARWVFNNATGVITTVCTGPFAGDCVTAIQGRIVSGYIRFIPIGIPPTDAGAENPVGVATTYPLIDVTVSLTLPTTLSFTPVCYIGSATYERPYFCAIPMTSGPPTSAAGLWSGRTELGGAAFAPLLATSLADADASRFKVCRYTPVDTHTPAGGNTAHPLDYALVNTALSNQNFLVHSAGDGTLAYRCPNDGPDPLLNSNTFEHQPRT